MGTPPRRKPAMSTNRSAQSSYGLRVAFSETVFQLKATPGVVLNIDSPKMICYTQQLGDTDD
jgi:hypothetical protein